MTPKQLLVDSQIVKYESCVQSSTVYSLMGKNDNQHLVPKTYLKHWRIAPNENFVWVINSNDAYHKHPLKKGIGDTIFTSKKFYNDNSFGNPYIIEEIFGSQIEPYYNTIMKEVTSEINLSYDVRDKLISWLFTSKMRSPIIRENYRQFAEFWFETADRYAGKEIDEIRRKQIREISNERAKYHHLNVFTEKETLHRLAKLFTDNLVIKGWKILKSKPSLGFWTNDNPGFSPNRDPRYAVHTPYHHIMELNRDSIIYFPLSPKYCIKMSPFLQGDPCELNAMTMDIIYEDCSFEVVYEINRGIHFSRYRLLISNDKQSLNKYVKWKN